MASESDRFYPRIKMSMRVICVEWIMIKLAQGIVFSELLVQGYGAVIKNCGIVGF